MSTKRRDTDWEGAWSVEIEQRVQDVAGGRVDLLDADDVHTGLRAEIERRAREARANPDDDVAWEAVREELRSVPAALATTATEPKT